jgi:hypothetical protein
MTKSIRCMPAEILSSSHPVIKQKEEHGAYVDYEPIKQKLILLAYSYQCHHLKQCKQSIR